MATIRDITMYEDVGFDATHKHCLDFPNETDRDNYFSNLRDKTFFRDANYNKVDNVLNLECEWETGLKFSYCSLSYGNKKMFFFVTGCKVVNEKVTGFQLQMDMWQTFLFDFKVGEGMITREHVDRWDKDGKILWRKGVNEDAISVYDKSETFEINQSVITAGDLQFKFGGIYITYMKKVTTENNEERHCYVTILIPTINPSIQGGDEETMFFIRYEDEGHVYSEPLISSFSVLYGNIFSGLSIDPESVISICYQPNIDGGLVDGITIESTPSPAGSDWWFINTPNNVPIFKKYTNRNTFGLQGAFYDNYSEKLISHTKDDYYKHAIQTFSCSGVTISKPVKPSNNDVYSPTHEPEMYKSPYIIRSILNVDGSLISEISDVCWYDNDAIRGFMLNDNNSIDSCYIFSNDTSITSNEFISLCNKGIALRLYPLDIDIPSDVWQSYMISSRDTDRQMLQSTINQQAISSSIGAIVGMGGISGMAGSGKTGGLGFNPYQAGAGAGIGAVMGVAGWVVNNHFGWEQQEIKEKAIRNQPNNLLRTSVGDGILKVLYPKHTYGELKCSDSAFNQASNRYHKFGYKVDMMGIPNIKTRKHFNFVQTSQVRIEGSMNQTIRDNIADIFNNGVTIWHGEYITKESGTNKFVTDYSKENIERSLI